MSNPQFGFDELEPNQSQPHVPVNAGDRVMSAAIAGEFSFEFETDENYTLGDDEWAYAVIRALDEGSEATLTADRDVIYPDVDSLDGVTANRMRFIFINDTAETLTIKRSGQTGVSVSAGEYKFVWHNGTDIEELVTSEGGGSGGGDAPVVLQVACSDLTTNLTTGTNKGYVRAPSGFTISDVRASLLTGSTSGAVTIDINKNGSTILSTKITIDEDEKTSETAATPAVVSDDSIADDDEITIDIDGAGTGAKGLIVTLIGE